jgi:hypothetical protein
MSLIDWAVIGIIILSLEITILIFLKLGRPSKWFTKDKK